MVYVLNKEGQPLMPTNRHGKVKHLLKEGKAIVVKRCPFTIQLTYDVKNYTQDIKVKVDEGSKIVGFSAVTNKKELYSSEMELRNDIVKLLSSRREVRRTRRNYKTRYRAPRFNNRRASKQKGWLPPSTLNKIGSHLKEIELLTTILPVTEIIVEVAPFDIQKIKKPDIKGIEYQEGETKGFENVREYVLYRDNHTCQCCKGKSKDKILQTHHIESRQTGGDAPNNLVTLCKTCHEGYHKGTVTLPKTIKRGASFRDAAFMSIMRWAFYNKLKELYPNIKIKQTYGYITKANRIANNLPKEHRIDALCIESNNNIEPIDTYYYKRKVRCHNRQIHKSKILKGGKRKLHQAPFEVFGFRLFDKVLYQGQECFIGGRRSNGYFKLINLKGEVIHESANHKKLKLINHFNSYLIEKRENNYKRKEKADNCNS